MILIFVVSTVSIQNYNSRSDYLDAIKRACHLNGSDLTTLNDTALKMIGIASAADRRKILDRIGNLLGFNRLCSLCN